MATRRPRTSCNPCRLARIGCDAALQRPSRCSNCVRRGRLCDVASQSESLASNLHNRPSVIRTQSDFRTRTPSNGHYSDERDSTSQLLEIMTPPDFDDFMPLTPISSGMESTACHRLQANVLNDMLWSIYFSIFEMRYAIWLGDSCCPYLEMTPKPRAAISRLVMEMDAYENAHEPSSPPYRYQAPHHQTREKHNNAESNALLDDALRHAIYAYSIRWLHVRSGNGASASLNVKESQQNEQDIRNYVWRRAKRAVMPALTRPSYRSILALLLITIAEVPAQADDIGFAQLCNHALFGHLNTLRSPVKWRMTQEVTMASFPQARPEQYKGNVLQGCTQQYSEEHQHNRDVVFWLCVVSSCSRTLTQQLPSVILPARSANHKVWQFIRQRTVIFDQSFKTLQGSQSPLPGDVAEVVLQHATACKTMYLSVINQLCDSLFYHNVSSVKDDAQDVLDESRRFHQVFDHLLLMCARDYTLLNEEAQLNYLLLISHYNLGTLILADIVESLDSSPEQLKDPCLSRLYACQAITNTLSLVINYDRYSSGGSTSKSKLLLDPAPDLMAEVLLRTCNAVFSMLGAAEILPHVAQTMLSVVFNALHVLSQVSNKASYVLSLCGNVSTARGLKIMYDYGSSASSDSQSSHDFGAGNDYSIDALHDFLHLMQIQASLDPSQFESMIKKRESTHMHAKGSLVL